MRVKNSTTRPSTSSEGQAGPIESGSCKTRQRRRFDKRFGLKPEYAAGARQICELGGTSADLAKAFGGDLDTISLWQSTNKEFAEACRLGMDAADQRVERALFQRAIGYTHKVDTATKQRGRVLIVQRNVPVPADPRAAKIWLEWREAKAARTHKNPLGELSRQLEGTALRPKEPPGPNGQG